MEELTFSSLHDSTKYFEITDEVITAIQEISKSNDILSIYSMNARAIYFFPVASDVYKLSIQIFPLTPEIVAKIMNKISELATKIVYSTGLCFTQESCTYEGYLDSSDLTISQDELKQHLSEIKGVSKVEITTLAT